MYQSRYFVDKSTATAADTLLAHGFATLLHELAGQAEVPLRVRVEDVGYAYAVALDQPVEPGWLKWIEPLPFLAAGRYSDLVPDGVSKKYDYEAERERRAAYFELRKQLRAAGVGPDDPEWSQLQSMTPDSGYDLFAKINQMSALIAYNGLAEQWHANKAAVRAQVEFLLELFSRSPNPMDEVAERWKKQAQEHGWEGSVNASASQVINPGMGKGANRSKADALTIGNQQNFWLLEYLKFLGAQEAMVPRVVLGSKDRKSYVLEPRNLTLRTGRRLFRDFQQVMWPSTAVKMDILAVLRWLRVFLQAQTEGAGSERARRLLGKQPNDFVEGLWAITYKDLGSAHAVMNLSLLRLPRWMRMIEHEEDARRYLDIVEEHRRVVESLDEKNSDAYELLRLYRDFLSGAELRAFFRFCGGYSHHLLQRMERRQFAPQFTVINLEELFMAHDQASRLRPILNDPGFQHVATAIRLSTVVPQYRKIQGERLYDIRYGLGERLLQKGRYPQEFVRELTEFMFQYNQENARIAERGKQFRRNLTTEDVERVIALVDEHGSDTVAGLLVAYGYARDPKVQGEQDTPPEEGAEADEDTVQ